MIVVVKAGTTVLTDDGNPSFERLTHLISQIASLTLLGHQVVLVSSGAIATGKYLSSSNNQSQSFYSGIGQVELMALYRHLLAKYNLLPGQILVTSSDLPNVIPIITEMLNQGIVPILNENDVITSLSHSQDYLLTDNDALASYLGIQLKADYLILLTDVEGVYQSIDPSQLIKIYTHQEVEIKSSSGRGGMRSKIDQCLNAVKNGVKTAIICSGVNLSQKTIVESLVSNNSPGTIFQSTDIN